jgi:zinc transport system substrate-binding protein
MKRIIFIVVLGFAALALLVVLERKAENVQHANNSKLLVSTSFYPLAFFAEQIVDNLGAVYNITPAGAEPHDYELSSKDRMRIEESNLVILNGGHLEPWGANIISILSGSQTKVISVGEILVKNNDPHVWLDPVLAEEEAIQIANSLKEIDPLHSSKYDSNLNRLLGELKALDQEYRTGLSSCKQKDIITSHEAFGYVAKRYGFGQVSIAGLSPDAEPSPEVLSNIVALARKKRIKYIFFESLVSPKLAEALAREVGAATLVLNPIEGLTDRELASGKNYLSEMRSNLNNLKIALECQ